MIKLEYRFEPKNLLRSMADLSGATDSALRYHYFAGDQIFVTESADFSACWGWIPILDFARQLLDVSMALKGGASSARLHFTENVDWLAFLRLPAGAVEISGSYVEAKAQVSETEFSEVVAAHWLRVGMDLARRNPSLCTNPTFLEWFPDSRNWTSVAGS